MMRKFSLLLTILAALGLAVALTGCGKKGALERPSDKQEEKDAGLGSRAPTV